jgi:hypothetical protein
MGRSGRGRGIILLWLRGGSEGMLGAHVMKRALARGNTTSPIFTHF